MRAKYPTSGPSSSDFTFSRHARASRASSHHRIVSVRTGSPAFAGDDAVAGLNDLSAVAQQGLDIIGAHDNASHFANTANDGWAQQHNRGATDDLTAPVSATGVRRRAASRNRLPSARRHRRHFKRAAAAVVTRSHTARAVVYLHLRRERACAPRLTLVPWRRLGYPSVWDARAGGRNPTAMGQTADGLGYPAPIDRGHLRLHTRS